MIQAPAPGTCLLVNRGDILNFSLTLPQARDGQAWLRTNIGNGRIRAEEIAGYIEQNLPILAHDWRDIPMSRIDNRHYSLTLPLLEVGRFEAKTFFLPENTNEPVWPEGKNIILKIEPAEYCCSTTIYTAFVRQYGPDKKQHSLPSQVIPVINELDSSGYTVIPRSGTFRDLIRELDFIIGKLRFRIIQLLPIHPIPTTYGRMGRFGSPFAALDFMDVDPALAEFDRKTTPLGQFMELADAVHKRNAKIFIDLPVNHTGWASKLQIDHPEWFARGEDRSFQSPGAWGVTWEDLSKLDYNNCELWKHMARIFLFWCRHGVDGFRCDAGYMVPCTAWEYITAKVRLEYPDTIFLLEGLGGKLETMENLLLGANLDWAYSELFQNYNQHQIESYLPGCINTSLTQGVLVHFAETHDNNRLASRSTQYARLRTALTALCSHNGAFGITNGVEWFAREKIDVHGATALNWGAKENQIDYIEHLNAILETHPAFYSGAHLRLVHRGYNNSIALWRKHPAHKAALLVLANLNEDQPNTVNWAASVFPPEAKPVYDLITGKEILLEQHNENYRCSLGPGQVLCLTHNPSDLENIKKTLARNMALPEYVCRQHLQAQALEIYRYYYGDTDVSGIDLDKKITELVQDPLAYCAGISAQKSYNQTGADSPAVITWEWPRDIKRVVMVPPGHFLYVKVPYPFTAELRDNEKVKQKRACLPQKDGKHFALFSPVERKETNCRYILVLTIYEPGKIDHAQATILYLTDSKNAFVRTVFDREEVQEYGCYALCTNGRGAMAQVRGSWGKIQSQYDAFLAGNLHPDYPVDRRIMLTRCRAWLVYRGYSQEINDNCLKSFALNPDESVSWHFAVPTGQGRQILLDITLKMHPGRNAITLYFHRLRLKKDENFLDNNSPVKIIVRPDIEDRSCHEKTKAYMGPENTWPGAVKHDQNSFYFSPSGKHKLRLGMSAGTFIREPEWYYMIPHPLEAQRGLDSVSDLFSPGYFTFQLKGGTETVFDAGITGHLDKNETAAGDEVPSQDILTAHQKKNLSCNIRHLDKALYTAMQHFIVKRSDSKTVIAGYPWFLDWGRDTLICLRGIIAAGMLDETREILKQSATFESQGTLPNMIRGADNSNRDTSDAPLWFFTACRDLINTENSQKFLSEDCGGRTIQDVLLSIAAAYIKGTPNGIKMDSESGLIFSPAHFTWMDTNHPAGTAREGYPVEIQALWYAALKFLSGLRPKEHWQSLADQVSNSIHNYFTINKNYLSDCLHAQTGQPAAKATADDALRPNQLLAVTLAAVTEPELCSGILASCEELLVPGAIRSLADRPASYALPIYYKERLLNNPYHPYWEHYEGDEDTRRKPAYHNGTAWTWLFPSYSEAFFMTYGRNSAATALAVLSSSVELINQGCLGQVPEIVDGDAPHVLRGCGAQAWGVTELYRVLITLLDKK